MPLRLGRRARRVEQVEEVFGLHRLARTRLGIRGLALDDVVPPVVSAVLHLHVAAGPAQDDAVLDGGRVLERRVGVLFQRHRRPAAPGFVLGNQHLAPHVLEPPAERVGGEAAEDDRMRGTEARAGEHRDRELGDHPHVDPDRRSLPHAERLQAVREADDFGLEIGEGELAPVVLRLALPEVRDLVAVPRLDVAIDAVEADVELAAQVPLGGRRLPLEQRAPRLEPGHPRSLLRPELLEIELVQVRLSVRLSGEVGRRRVAPHLLEHRLDRSGPLRIGHGVRS